MLENQQNWAGNYTYSAARLHCPETVEEVQELVTQYNKLKALGTRHSFNEIADSREDLISLEHFDQVLNLDRDRGTVTVGAGMRYGELCRYLHREGCALHNLASLPHISVAGSCATATHGSGPDHGNLATAVSAIELVTGAGEVVALSRERDAEQFQGTVVGLGGAGIITTLTLSIVPAFTIQQNVYENLPLSEVEEHFDDIVASAYSVSLFTDWRDARFNQVWLKRRVSGEGPAAVQPDFFGATLATRPLHPIPGPSPENCTEQLGLSGPWHERLPHFRLEYTPSSGEELQSEYLVPRENAVAALQAISRLREHVVPLLQISEVRTIAADNLWMSPCYEQACVGIHFTWHKNWPAVTNALPMIEEQLGPLGARPHWGKLFTMSPGQLQPLYPRLPDFQQLLRDYDPQGKFRNSFLDTHILASP